MKKQDLNVFNISFLDLMTGAFAAVIILFIVVPKLNVEDREAIEKLKKLKVEMREMDSIVLSLKASIPEREYNALTGQISKMQTTMGDLEREIEDLRTKLKQERLEKEELQALVTDLEQQLADAKTTIGKYLADNEALKAELERLKAENQKLRKALEKVQIVPEDDSSEVTAYVPIKDSETVVDTSTLPSSDDIEIAKLRAPLGLVATWGDDKTDIDLYLQKGGLMCYNYVRNRDMPFGSFVNVKKYKQFFNEKTTEIIAQDKEVVPGEYQVYLHQRSPKTGETQVNLQITFAAQGKIPRRINKEITVPYTSDAPYKGGGTLVGTLTVTEDGIAFRDAK
ncbi:MAG: CHAD domain-containing protein [Lewinellaceae bacterium]|nr:CHAD domain-containing protein [Saprospiraceae bacterium]MCB9338311.1 CHAD domain-containing protein [Lewinellaceae bacterium]